MRKSAKDEARRWLEQAESDFQSARMMMDNRSYDWACFAFQQAAEKALKAFLYGEGERLVFGHSVTKLLEDCSKYDRDFSRLARESNGLDAFYIPTRYPNGLPDSIPAKVYNANETKEKVAAGVWTTGD